MPLTGGGCRRFRSTEVRRSSGDVNASECRMSGEFDEEKNTETLGGCRNKERDKVVE
jgi:hypothetical protein